MVRPPVPALFGLLAAAVSSVNGAAECPSSAWIPFRSSCYIFLHGTLNDVAPFDDARDLCKDNASGADIISIKNREENTFIEETFENHWQAPDYILLGMFFDADDNTFKWFDKSEMKFTNWIEEESNEELLNTCASMNTKSGGWRKISCENLPLAGTLCKAAFAYEKTYLPDKTALTTTLVIVFTIVVTVSAALFWFLYKRSISSGALCITHHSTTEIPYSDETILIDEENEYTA
ncbi:CD302 antigen [Carettochelys insculpta]|uniref:CD302 antigen n=1 Tax=Carettochelys insculpta TaxID=44489 RepID=UPI003EBE0CB7